MNQSEVRNKLLLLVGDEGNAKMNIRDLLEILASDPNREFLRAKMSCSGCAELGGVGDKIICSLELFHILAGINIDEEAIGHIRDREVKQFSKPRIPRNTMKYCASDL